MNLFLQRVKKLMKHINLQVSKLKVIETPSLASSPFAPRPAKNFVLSFVISFLIVYGLYIIEK